MGRAARRKQQSPAKSSASPTDSPSEPRYELPLPRWLAPTLLFLEVCGFLLLKCYGLHPHRVDEGIYFYDAARLVEGARLYRDLFFAHPPLQLVYPYLILRYFGYSLLALKSISPLMAAAQGVLTYLIARRICASDLAGLVAAAVLLYGHDFLLASCYYTGINEADALLFGAVLAVLYRRFALSGVLAGAATMTLLQAAPVAAVLGLAVLGHDAREGFRHWRRQGLHFVLAFGAVVGLVHVYFTATAGAAFFDQVYAYHLHKTASESAGSLQLGFLYADNLVLFAGGTVALALATSPIEPRVATRRCFQIASAAALFQTLVMTAQPRVFPFYFQPLFPLLAMAVGWAAAEGLRRALAPPPARRRATGLALVAGVCVLPLLLAVPLTEWLSPRRAEQRRTYAQSYLWRDAPLVGARINSWVQSWLFANGERAAGSTHLGATEYLWNQTRAFDSYPSLVAAVAEHCPLDGTIFGDSASTPLVALGSRRRITADFADTNAQRFASGTTPPDEAIAQLEAQGGPTLILSASHQNTLEGLFGIHAFQRYLAEHYEAFVTYSDGDGTKYTLYHRRVEGASEP